jgi:zinc-binding alcohol dehydrogenase family protein
MKAVGYQISYPSSDPRSLVDIEMPEPVVTGHDLLVEVKAVAVNPVDTKIRMSSQPSNDCWKVLGWDAAGTVRAVGKKVTLFQPGDRVWYAGSIIRPGTNSELHLVDERIAGPMPSTLDFASSAALPLTSLTAWEMLFERLAIERGDCSNGKSILIIGAAGGVGSIMIQLARRLTGLTIIATASRPESKTWVKNLGAHFVIDHSKNFSEQLNNIGINHPEYVVSLSHTENHFDQIAEVIAPQGKFGLIDDPAVMLDIMKLKRKSVSIHWELMFTRSLYTTSDINNQHHILSEIASLIDNRVIHSTLTENYGTINAENLRRAHALIESGKSKGKIVLENFK